MQVTWLEFYSKLRKENVKVEQILNKLFLSPHPPKKSFTLAKLVGV